MNESMGFVGVFAERKQFNHTHKEIDLPERCYTVVSAERRTIDETVCELFLWMEQMEMLGMGGGKVVI
tara:strand:+ start:195 stop:398 length:204 start_codon:yes stop_codon:yes gene_type:complete